MRTLAVLTIIHRMLVSGRGGRKFLEARPPVSWVLVVALVHSFFVLLLSGAATAAPTTISEFSAGLAGGAAPRHMTPGPDGNVWFTANGEDAGGKIRAVGRIMADGSINEFTEGLEGGELADIVAGPDGHLWFGIRGGNGLPAAIGRVSVTGEVTRSKGLRVNTFPNDLAVGADGNIWFASTAGLRPGLGRITPSGTISQFDLPAYPHALVAGPDGNMWFTYGHHATAAVGRAAKNEAGGVTITLFSDGLSEESSPRDIVLGSDGNLWFTDRPLKAIGRVTPDGEITEFTGVTIIPGEDIVAGPDGNVWYPDWAGIGRITTAGVATIFRVPSFDYSRHPHRITTGHEGNLWFTAQSDGGPGSISRITPAGVATEFTQGLRANSQPSEIIAGPDGKLWFSDPEAGAIGRVIPGDDADMSSSPQGAVAPAPILENHGPGRITLARHPVTVRDGRVAILAVRCVNGTRCAGRMALRAKRPTRHGKRPRRRWGLIGATSFSIEAGPAVLIEVRLNRRGRHLFRLRRGRLASLLRASGPASHLARTKRARVRLVRAKKFLPDREGPVIVPRGRR